MPKLPKWAADFMESAFSSMVPKVTVTAVTYLTPVLKKIRFEGDLAAYRCETGYAIIIRVDETNYRNYTPSFFDRQAGICDVIFHLHGNGPGSAFADKLNIGDTLLMGMPRGRRLYKKDSSSHFFFGDETTLGLFDDFRQLLQKENRSFSGIIELSEEHAVPGELLTGFDTVLKSSGQATAAVERLMVRAADQWEEWKDGTFYLLGNAGSIQQFRKALKELGVKNSQIYTQPYWAEGKTGL